LKHKLNEGQQYETITILQVRRNLVFSFSLDVFRGRLQNRDHLSYSLILVRGVGFEPIDGWRSLSQIPFFSFL